MLCTITYSRLVTPAAGCKLYLADCCEPAGETGPSTDDCQNSKGFMHLSPVRTVSNLCSCVLAFLKPGVQPAKVISQRSSDRSKSKRKAAYRRHNARCPNTRGLQESLCRMGASKAQQVWAPQDGKADAVVHTQVVLRSVEHTLDPSICRSELTSSPLVSIEKPSATFFQCR